MGRSKRIKPERLGEKLYQIRIGLDLTQEKMIEKLDYGKTKLHPQNISGFEKSEREPNLLILLSYARLADISTDILIDDKLDLPKHFQIIQKNKKLRNKKKAI